MAAITTYARRNVLMALLSRVKRSQGIFATKQTPKLRTDWQRGGYVAQTQSEYLARMTPDVVAADWERRQFAA